jgi:hypothetical protein
LSPKASVRLHFWLTCAWLAAAVPCILIRGLRESVPLLVFISIYANCAGHFSAYQAAKAEQMIDDN